MVEFALWQLELCFSVSIAECLFVICVLFGPFAPVVAVDIVVVVVVLFLLPVD